MITIHKSFKRLHSPFNAMPVHLLQWKVWSLSHLRVLILHGLVILLETWNCNTTQVTPTTLTTCTHLCRGWSDTRDSDTWSSSSGSCRCRPRPRPWQETTRPRIVSAFPAHTPILTSKLPQRRQLISTPNCSPTQYRFRKIQAQSAFMGIRDRKVAQKPARWQKFMTGREECLDNRVNSRF